jgi:hypothetical protein
MTTRRERENLLEGENEAFRQKLRANAAGAEKARRHAAWAAVQAAALQAFRTEMKEFLDAMRTESRWVKNLVTTAEPTHVQPARRASVRASFAFVEGVLSVLKSFLLAHDAEALPVKVVGALKGETYQVTESGEVKVRPQFIATKENLRLCIRTFASVHAPAFRVELGGPGWRAFSEALQVRHRITHPRSAANLEVSLADMETVDSFVGWFGGELKKLLASMRVR